MVLLPGVASAQTIEWEAIASDGFESGDTTGWDAENDPDGDLSASNAAALDGTFGLEAVVNDTSGLYVQDDTPADDSYYRARFLFDPNGFDPGESQSHFRTRIFIGFEDGPRRLFAVVLRRIGGQYAIMGRARRDDNSQANTGFVNVSDDVHTIELYWKRSSGPGANNGTFEISIDGVPSTLTGLDNDVSSVDFARMGALSVKTGAAGNLYWDAFESFRNLTAARAQLVINEVDYDQIGTDTNEFVELYNRGPAAVPLAGVALFRVNGFDSLVYGFTALTPAGSLAPGQYLVIASGTVTVDPGALVILFAAAQDNVQNGAPDGLLLGHLATCQVIDALSYEGSITAASTAPSGCGNVNLVEGLPATEEDEAAIDGSLGRVPSGFDSNNADADWRFGTTPTPGAANQQTTP
jgi:hypothetical protein